MHGSPPTDGASGVDIRRAADRAVTRTDWLDSRHSFSFGGHYDPANTHHGVLLVHNDDIVAPGRGFDTHPHRDMEIVTWVLRGALAHQDSAGHVGVIGPGLAQRMSAGRGILHAERNAAAADGTGEEVRFVQMWVAPDTRGLDPGYEQAEIDGRRLAAGLVPVVSGLAHHHATGAVRIANRFAALHVARLRPGASVELPRAPYLHLFVAVGEVTLAGAGPLRAGDAARLTATSPQRVSATAPTEILLWEMHADLDGLDG